MHFVPDTDEWLNRRVDNGDSDNAWGEWTMMGGQMHILPALAADRRAYFAYLHKNCVALASGGVSDVFQNDDDRFALDERVLKLGMIWQWKAQKGSPYAEDMGTYGDALTNAMGHDSPGPIIVGRGRPIYRRKLECLGGAMSQHQFFRRTAGAAAGGAAVADHHDPGADPRADPERERSLHAARRGAWSATTGSRPCAASACAAAASDGASCRRRRR